MNKLKSTLLIIAVAVCVSNLFGQNKNSKILFVEFTFKNGVPEILKMEAVPGKLKQPKKQKTITAEFSFEALSKKNNILYSGVIENPDKIIYEYPSENGEIKKAEIERESKRVFVRMPYCPQLDKLVLYKNAAERALKKSTAEKFEFFIKHADIKKD